MVQIKGKTDFAWSDGHRLVDVVSSRSVAAKKAISGTTPKSSVETAKPEAERPTDRDYVGEQLQSLLKLTATMCRSSWSKNSTLKSKMSNLTAQGWKDKFNVLLASGQIPDIFPIDADETDMASMGGSGYHCQHFTGRNPKNDAELYESAGID